MAKKKFDLEDLIKKNIEFFKHIKDERIIIKYYIDPNLEKNVFADYEKLEQLIYLLIKNSINLTQQGSIIIKLDLVNLTNFHMHIKFSIIDSGIGMSQEEQFNLFKFFSMSNENIRDIYKNTNSNLFQIKTLVDELKANIGFTSELMAGSKFYFRIKLRLAKKNIDLNDTRENGENIFLKGIDSRDALYRLGANTKNFKQLLIAFYFEFENIMEEIENLEENKQFKELEELLHKLKGSSSNISAHNLYKVSSSAEIFFKKNQYISNEILEDLKLNLNTILETCRPYTENINKETKGKIKKILIIDNEAKNIKELIKILEKKYSLFATTKILQVNNIINKIKPDLIILDLALLKSSEFNIEKQVPRIFVGAKAEIDNNIVSLNSNIYISKPISEKELLKKVILNLKLKTE